MTRRSSSAHAPRRSSSAKRVSRPLLTAALLFALSGCAPDAAAGTQRVEVDGVITQVVASSGGRTYMLDVAGQGFLPLDMGNLRPPIAATGVVVEAPAVLEIPGDEAGRFAALSGYTADTGSSLVVVSFLP